ncbi:MAG: methionyl-tRNA formyltransferase [Ignavibacteria bacterium]|jgi:methionyl-tRNA formyltransferase|nr:methionyl-tRNA formyltransferase [Ignavibacteria bacterium]MDH7527421.1 methionyl-tRNA formyltransferase [Ignavibacteria bacterium]
MKIIFFGTPEFAIPSLNALLENGYEISAVVTVPDKEKGRGLKPEPSPVKKFALSKNLKVLQPEKLKDENFFHQLKEINPDLGIVVAYRILPKEVYTLPKFGTFNLHASLLPKYRGAAPIQWALINGEKVTGVTTFFLQEKVDTGNIILQREVLIDDEDNFQTLHDKLAQIGAELVIETVKLIENGSYNLKVQDDSKATRAPKITKEICLINWHQRAQQIHNLVRGLSPIPAAFTYLGNKLIKIYKTKLTNENSDAEAGVIEVRIDEILVNTSDYKISILELQPESRKRMSAKEFLLGYKNLIDQYKKFSI